MKIVIDSQIPFLKGLLEPFCTTVYKAGGQIYANDVRDADALLIRTRTLCNKSLLEGSRVKFIGTATIGFDHIDTNYCSQHGIYWATAAGCNARGVLQWVAAALALIASEQSWQPQQKTLGVVGVGHVGSLVARYARHWGFNVLCSDPPRERAEGLNHKDGFVALEQIAREADIITFHVPLVKTGEDKTVGLANKEFFGRLKHGAIVMNSSRGDVVDLAALKAAVEQNACACCLDTWHNEPDIDSELLSRALVSTPHIAGYTLQGKANGTAAMVGELALRFDCFKPLQSWYPSSVERIKPVVVDWSQMCEHMPRYFDIVGESAHLKRFPQDFENRRSNYPLREEFF